ncbi:MAG TPA: hypothetical protein VGI40_07965 [Pirellulaceae bacterium]|jgi:hypothetical protein
MKKPKISLDKDKLQQLFLLHIEKILLVIVVGLMVLLVYRGFSLPHLEPSLSPQALIDKTRGAKQYIDDPNRWTEVSVLPDRQPDFSIVKQVGDVQKPSDPMAYMLVNTWSRPDFPKLSPREDPTLFAPEKLIVRPVIGPLASYPRTESENVDPLFPQKTEEQIRADRKKKEIEDKKKKKEEEKLAGGEGATGRPERKKKGKPGASEESGETSTRRGGPMAYGGENGAANPGGLYPEAAGLGYLPQNAEQTIARDVASVTLMALVPIQRQTEEYDKKFTESLDYDPRRDAPYYMEYRVQRADVTDVDPATEADKLPWENLPAPARVFLELAGDQNTGAIGLYAGFPTEVVDPSYLGANYLSPESLAHPAPPYLSRNLWDLLTHPDVPLAAVNPAYAEGVASATKPAGTPSDDDAPSSPTFGAPGMPGMPGMPGGGEGGYGSGMRLGMNRMGGGGEGGMPGMGGGMRPGGGMTMPRPGGAPMMGGGEGGYGAAGMATSTPPKYQLIRFTDVNVKPGRKYRYRTRVMVHDPNHPMLGVTPPTNASLAETARKRVKEIDTSDAARPKDKQTGLAYRTYWLWTPWSEPSPIAEVPHGERVFAGKVTQRMLMRLKNVDVTDEPAATALAVVFAQDKVADVPGEIANARRGYVLNVALDGKSVDKDKIPKVIHPVTKEVVDLDKYNIVTNAMVADIMGGEQIRPIVTTTASQTLTNIGEMLIMDANGKLHVQNEADDILQFRRYTVPKEEKPKKKEKDDTAGGLEGGRPRRGSD